MGILIKDSTWESLPRSLQLEFIKYQGLTEPVTENTWSTLGEAFINNYYGWNVAHLRGGTEFNQKVTVSELKSYYSAIDYFFDRYPNYKGIGLPNFAGLKVNLLTTVSIAKEEYKKNIIQKLGEVNDDTDLSSLYYYSCDKCKALTFKEVITNFETLQSAWYEEIYQSYKPIIGGISGQALKHMNMYLAALENKAKNPKYTSYSPSLETMRAILISGLLGNQRHHSYDEVFTPTHKMTNPVSKEVLQYQFRQSYEDILVSENPVIYKMARLALEQTKEYISQSPVNTVLCVLGETIYKNDKNSFLALKELLKLTISENSKRSSIISQIKENVNAAFSGYDNKDSLEKANKCILRLNLISP